MTSDQANEVAVMKLLQFLAAAGGTGLAARAGLAAVSPSTHPSVVVKKPKRMIVPLPAPPEEAKLAQDSPNLLLQGFRLDAPDWLKSVAPGMANWWDRHTPEQTPISGAGITDPTKKPWYMAAAGLGGLGAAGLGWGVGDRMVLEYQRRKAQEEIEKARQDYHQQVLKGYEEKTAADAGYVGEPVRRIKAALDRAWAVLEGTKSAEDALPPAAPAGDPGFEKSLLYRVLFPLTHLGSEGAATSALLSTVAAGGGLYGGYRAMRDTDTERARRQAVEAAERDELAERPPIVVGEITRPKPPVSLGRRMALAGG